MENLDYHSISLKFLTAVILALFFAFLMVYVFTADNQLDYAVYSFEKEALTDISAKELFTAAEKKDFFRSPQHNKLKTELRNDSFEIMAETKKALLAVVTADHFEEINTIFEKERAVLNELRLELRNKREKLLQQKRNDLEAELSASLRQLRQKVRKEYSDFNQQEIGANYLQIINLKIAVEVLAKNEAEKERYQKNLAEVEKEQQQLLAEKNSARNDQISAETRSLIMEFNSRYSEYREKIDNRQNKILTAKEKKIEQSLNKFRDQIKLELRTARAAKKAELEKLITEQKKFY